MTADVVKIGEACKVLNVSRMTLLRWEESGELLPARKSKAGTRWYAMSDLLGVKSGNMPTVCYARVSSPDEKDDLGRQQAALEGYCAAKGCQLRTIKDLGSGIHYRKKGFARTAGIDFA